MFFRVLSRRQTSFSNIRPCQTSMIDSYNIDKPLKKVFIYMFKKKNNFFVQHKVVFLKEDSELRTDNQ